MRVNSKTLSIPPYISTEWKYVSSLKMDGEGNLVIQMVNGTQVKVPGMPGNDIEQIFNAHAEYLENPPQSTPASNPLSALGSFGIGIPNAGIGQEGLESFTGLMQHDPNQKDAPNIPSEILDKIASVSKALGIDADAFNLPESEPHCNCPYCQISKAMADTMGKNAGTGKEDSEEPVSDEELTFRDWEIASIGEKLYKVSSPLNNTESYQVYLGEPIGCTCGKNNCEHIIAVLNS